MDEKEAIRILKEAHKALDIAQEVKAKQAQEQAVDKEDTSENASEKTPKGTATFSFEFPKDIPEMKVSNLNDIPKSDPVEIPPYPEEMRISNLDEIEFPQFPKASELRFPESINIKKPAWLPMLFVPLRPIKELLEKINDKIQPFKLPSDPIEVKVVNQQQHAVFGGGGTSIPKVASTGAGASQGTIAVPVVNPDGSNISGGGGSGGLTNTELRASAVPVSVASLPSHAVTNAGIFAVQATQSSNWTSRIVGNAGGVLDAVLGAAVPANALQIGVQDNSNNLKALYSARKQWNSYSGQDGSNLLAVGLFSGNGDNGWLEIDNLNPASDGDGIGSKNGYVVGAMNYVWNGSSFDKRKSGGVTGMAGVSGDTAHDAVDAGNPVKVGGKAVSSEPTAVSAADRTNFITDLVGKHIVLPYANPENFVSGVITSAMTGTTSTSLLAAPGVGLRNYITTIIVSNAHATQGTDMIIQDGSGGTTLLTIPAAAVYGGAVIPLPVPLRQPTTNTAIFIANVTTGASTKASVVGYKGI